MNKKEIIQTLINNGIEANEAKAETALILETVLNKTKEELLFIDEINSIEIENIIKERVESKKPIQYILKSAPFMGQSFYVDENVLIPRDDTEILVQTAYSFAKDGATILDIGTGSGIIALMLGHLSKENNRNFEIIGVDISTPALCVAICNMKNLNLQKTVMFRKSDIFSNVREKFDIIVSNPPYIPIKEYETIQSEVKFEPALALYTKDDDGLFFYKKIINEAKNYLNEGGFLIFEMMKGQADAIKALFVENNFLDIEIIKDVSGIERVIKARL